MFTAMWSSQEGSLLLWAWVLSIVSTVALLVTRHKLRDIVPWATSIMLGVGVFFTGLMLFGGDVNPFATLSQVPVDGTGLNPLLQHPSMIIHPPMLYTCLLYTSDAADDLLCVDLGGRRILQKKKTQPHPAN